VVARQFENQRPRSAGVAECTSQPSACRKTYRPVVVQKAIAVEKGERLLCDTVGHSVYVTDAWVGDAEALALSANGRCDRENLRAQPSGGVRALRAPVDHLGSNWAYRVRTALAWNLKAGWALTPPARAGRWHGQPQAEKRWVVRVGFKRSGNAVMRLPCPIVRTGRELVYRLPGWNP